MIKGVLIGGAIGFLFFKSPSIRNTMMYYGTGFGLGMSYLQGKSLYNKVVIENIKFKYDDEDSKWETKIKRLFNRINIILKVLSFYLNNLLRDIISE